MITMLRRLCLVCIATAMLASTSAAQLSEWDTASDSYGRGVHAYFAGRYGDAEAWLSRALEFNPDDPRPYYFRALSLMRLGRSDEACSDLEIGASLEAERPNRYGVGVALQRVQGSDRLALEKYRRQALTGATLHRRLSRAENAPRLGDESQVLYQPVVVPLDRFIGEGIPTSLTSEELARRAANAEARASAGAAAQKSPSADPFADDAAAGAQPAAPAPRSAPAESAEETAPAEEEMPASDEASTEVEEPADDAPASSTEPPATESSEADPFEDL